MATPNPLASSLSAPPISKRTLVMSGLPVDLYGLSEVPTSATHLSVLWLHHPRLRSRGDMASIASLVLARWHETQQLSHPTRGFVAVAWDQRNHGERIVRPEANESWKTGNETHAPDMLGCVMAAVADNKGLMEVVGAYIFAEGEEAVERVVDQHLVLGVSLGGHSAWQLMFAEPRVTAGVIVIGCPRNADLMQDRSRLSKRPSFKAEDNGASFFGSKDFPSSLVEACKQFDPKGIVFGTSPPYTSPNDAKDEARLRKTLDAHSLRGKRFLCCSGKDDKLVPYRTGQKFMDFFTGASEGWYKDSGMSVQDLIYEGVGHEFSDGMIKDAVAFLVSAVVDMDGKEAAAKI